MKIKNALLWGHEVLTPSSDSARLDAELLLAHVLRKPVTFLLAHDDHELGFFKLWRYKRLVEKRKAGWPVAYLTGHKEFYFLDLFVNRHVLVPRPDTEILVEAVIDYLRAVKTRKSLLLLDVGTGSGCIPIAVLKNAERVKAIATDISSAALGVAKRNVRKYAVQDRIQLFKSDLLGALPAKLFKGREVIVTANLPYIPSNFSVHPSTKFEPDISLYGGKDGLDVYKRLMDQLKFIKPKAVFLELFEFQTAILATRLKGYELKYVKTMSGQARLMMMERVEVWGCTR